MVITVKARYDKGDFGRVPFDIIRFEQWSPTEQGWIKRSMKPYRVEHPVWRFGRISDPWS